MRVKRATRSRNGFEYLDFLDAETLFADAALTDALVTAYQAIFGDSKGWSEHYERDEVLSKLRTELAGAAGLRLCVRREAHPVVAGFCWAQMIGVPEILAAIRTIKYFQSLGAPDLGTSLAQLLGAEPVIYVHDLGVQRVWRGGVPLTQLAYPVVRDISQRTGATNLLFWSIPSTHLSLLARRALFRRGLGVGEMEFYLGSVGQVEALVKRVAVLERARTAVARRPAALAR